MHNGIITTDTDIVLDTWKNDFEKLYNPSLENMDVAFANEIEKQKHDLENDREAEFQTTLNTHILLEKVEKAISHCKNNKAPGIDQIPNEAIKNPSITKLLHTLFVYCFNNSVVPKMWLRSLIKPIPKKFQKNPFLPQNYRGISLISCTAKIYSSLLNSRLTSFLEDNNTQVDEQNAFRCSRSCEDHVFVLSSIIDSREHEGKSTFVAFIAMSKAFDCINRNKLYFKLLKNKINGNYYNAIIALYKETESCVQINSLTTTWYLTRGTTG